MSVQQAYLGKFSLSSSANTFALNDGVGHTPTINVTVGSYYIAGYTSETATQLCETIQALIRAETGFSTATVTFSYSTGKVTLTFNATTSVTWTDSALRDLLGFTADLSGSTSYTSTNQCRYVWMPTRAPSEFPMDINRFWTRNSTSKAMRSRDGSPHGVTGNVLYEAAIAYTLVDDSEVIVSSSGSVNKELETFWVDCLAVPSQIRIFPDRTIYTGSGYVTALMACEGDSYGSLADYIGRNIESYNGLWDVSLRFWKYTP